MAHPCINCGGECYCHGDIDDCIVSKTPHSCEGCGCEEMLEDSGYWPDDDDEDDDWDPEWDKIYHRHPVTQNRQSNS